MKKVSAISLLVFSGYSFSACHEEKKAVDVSNLSGAYYSETDSQGDLQLMPDSCFEISIANVNSDFYAEFSGKWKLQGNTIMLSDTTTEFSKSPVYLEVNADGQLRGKYSDQSLEFKRKEK